ncbi:MAG: T9SS type A sorting domain-containing protein [Bacteroidia bacterium]|nr:T9SS type A sorting domain-containing protein [Bacteroidia bacterium]
MKLLCTFLLTLALIPVFATEPVPAGFATMQVYPNPSSTGRFSLELAQIPQGEQVEIRIFNLIGNEVYMRAAAAGAGVYQQQLDLSAFPKGVYMLEIRQGSQKQTRRLSYI